MIAIALYRVANCIAHTSGGSYWHRRGLSILTLGERTKKTLSHLSFSSSIFACRALVTAWWRCDHADSHNPKKSANLMAIPVNSRASSLLFFL